MITENYNNVCAEGNICVQNLNVHYGDNHVLKNINITIPNNKITAIIGPSGCGKTTLLKCFNRLIEGEGVSVQGKVLLDGEDIFAKGAEVTRLRKKMGLLSQRPYPLPMSIYENIAYGPRIHGFKKTKSEMDSLVEHYLKEASLWDEVKDRLNTPASRLSIGQQQRLCLARGLAVEPEIILGDEPTSALDPISSSHIEQKFMELREDYTIIVVTHILRQAKRIADYLIFMYMGEIVEHGPAKEILENPREKKTQEYIFGKIS